MKDEEEILDAWQRRTDRVSAGVFDRYFLDGNTRRLSALRRLEDAFDKVRREVRGTTVGDVPAVWMLYNMGVVGGSPGRGIPGSPATAGRESAQCAMRIASARGVC